jgi:flavin-dependent dehydrogenase
MDAPKIVVIGAGPAGSATACWLARAGLSVTLIERSRFERLRLGESLAPSVQPLLRELGAWDAFQAQHPLPSFGTRTFWGDPQASEQAHLATPYLNGWHVDRRSFDEMLAMFASAAGVHVRLGARVVACQSLPAPLRGMELHIADDALAHRATPEVLRADFVVDASGRGSHLARNIGARRMVFDRLVAAWRQVSAAAMSEQCFVQVEAVPEGWWYSAPLPCDRFMVMLMSDGDLLRSQHSLIWQQALARAPHTRARVGLRSRTPSNAELFSERAEKGGVASSISQRLVRQDAGREPFLAVGDAALAVDPLSGSGVVRALRMAREAAQAVLKWFDDPRTVLVSYEAARDRDCTAYLVERSQYYGAERRWPNAPFWQRRLPALDHARELASLLRAEPSVAVE